MQIPEAIEDCSIYLVENLEIRQIHFRDKLK